MLQPAHNSLHTCLTRESKTWELGQLHLPCHRSCHCVGGGMKNAASEALSNVSGKAKFHWEAKPASTILHLSKRAHDSHHFVLLQPLPDQERKQ